MKFHHRIPALVTLLAILPLSAFAEEHLETFDTDPGWEGINNRSTHYEPREITQDFGYAPDIELAGVNMEFFLKC